MARKNASFTLDQTYGSGHGDRTLIQAFYRTLNELIPGDTPIPIPPESQVHPKHDAKKQAFIFADFAVRTFAPITLRAVGLASAAAELERLKPITNKKTADDTSDLVKLKTIFGPDVVYHATVGAINAAYAAAVGNYDDVGREVAENVETAALNPDATWAAVNAMLQAL